MNPFAARAGVDGSRLLSGSMYAYGQLGADLVTPSIEGWTAEDARLFEILGSKGTGSPEGQALIKDLEAQHGAGNWYPAWIEMQDALTEKYNAALSDAERLAELQAADTSKDYGTQYVPGGAIPYSLHDMNAFAEMSVEEQAEFLLGFSDPNAAGYFAAASGATKDGVGRLMDIARGIKYMGRDGALYDSYEEMIAAGDRSPGVVTSVTTSTGEVITDPTRLENLTHEEVFGTPSQPSQPVTGGFDPSSAFEPTTTFPTKAPSVQSTSPTAVYPGTTPPLPSSALAPTTGGDDFATTAPTAPAPTSLTTAGGGKVKGQPSNLTFGTNSFAPTPSGAPAVTPEEFPEVATAGFGGGMIGLLALGGLALAVLAGPKRKR